MSMISVLSTKYKGYGNCTPEDYHSLNQSSSSLQAEYYVSNPTNQTINLFNMQFPNTLAILSAAALLSTSVVAIPSATPGT
jgi:hypothetical protein